VLHRGNFSILALRFNPVKFKLLNCYRFGAGLPRLLRTHSVRSVPEETVGESDSAPATARCPFLPFFQRVELYRAVAAASNPR
jgi:hypothetical protein